jgi:hypothetical protein
MMRNPLLLGLSLILLQDGHKLLVSEGPDCDQYGFRLSSVSWTSFAIVSSSGISSVVRIVSDKLLKKLREL